MGGVLRTGWEGRGKEREEDTEYRAWKTKGRQGYGEKKPGEA